MARTDTTDPNLELNRADLNPATPRHYRAHIDGLRAVAVYLVVAFHAGLGAFAGGFVGVDVFFVLSGYLVTGILLRDLVGSGRINFRNFYARRFRRILPAASVALIVTALVYAAIATPVEMLNVVGGFKAAFLYVANWYFIRQSVDYFASDINRSPVLHFWSLAVEEQFYLVWPLLFGGLFLATRRIGRLRWWVLRGIVVVAAIASAAAAWHIAATNVNRAYYGTDTRAYQLLGGAFIAVTPQLLRLARKYAAAVRVAGFVALAGLIVIATSMWHAGPIARGFAAVAFTGVLIVSLENLRNGSVARALSTRPMAYLGRVSYATYLWHWPVVVIATHSRTIAPLPLFVVTTVLSTELAILSFHFIERPVRGSVRLDRYKTVVIAVGLTISLVAGLVLLPEILTPSTASISGASGIALDWKAAQKDIPDLPDCLGRPVSDCTIVQGTGKRLMLVGDSNARMWIPTFTAIAQARGMSLSVLAFPNCPWQLGLQYDKANAITVPCRAHQKDWYARVIPQLAPDIIVLVHQTFDSSVRSENMLAANGHQLLAKDRDFEPGLDRESGNALHTLGAPGRRLVVLEPIPIPKPPFDPLSCVSNGTRLSACAYDAGPSPSPLEAYYRSVANGKSVIDIDADRLVCPRLPTCDAVIGGAIVKRDPSHLTGSFARGLAAQMTALLTNKGVLPAH